MSEFTDIAASLDSHLNNMPDLPPVAWENINYEPVQGTLFLRPTNLQGETRQNSIGDNGEDRTNGIYQIDVFADSNIGKGSALAIVDSIANHFKRGTDIDYNGLTVRIQSVSRGTSSNSDGWYLIPVNVRYYSITQART